MIKSSRKAASAKRIRKELDLILKVAAHERDGYRCLVCKKTAMLQAAHIHSKGKYPRLRYELDNILTLCYACHLHWAHKEPLEFADWVRANWPERTDRLHSLKNKAPKINLKELWSELRTQ